MIDFEEFKRMMVRTMYIMDPKNTCDSGEEALQFLLAECRREKRNLNKQIGEVVQLMKAVQTMLDAIQQKKEELAEAEVTEQQLTERTN